MKTKNRFTKQLLSIFLSIAMLLSLVPSFSLTAFAAAADAVTVPIDTGDSVTLTDDDGDGYYEINTADKLYAFAALVNNGSHGTNAKLTADITINTGTITESSTNARRWTPIGNNDYKYTGTFDGGNHTVSGIYANVTGTGTDYVYVGMFGYVGSGGAVRDVDTTNSYFSGTSTATTVYAGGVVGYNYGSVSGCSNTGTVTSNASGGFAYVGGVVGYNFHGSVSNCSNTGDVSGTSTKDADVGGVVGFNYHSIVSNCSNTGDVSGTSNSTVFVGGVVGSAGNGNSNNSVNNCYNTGDVSDTGNGTATTVYVGGVVGRNYITVSNCYNTGDVSNSDTATTVYAGGVVGSNSGTVTKCYYLDKVGDTSNPGGIQGADAADKAEKKTTAQFASGEVAYQLQGNQTDQIWGQTIGIEKYPVLNGAKVYQVKGCDGTTDVYSNTNENGAHSDADNSGRCDICNSLMKPAALQMVSISLKGNIAINYYMLLSDEVAADETAYMQFTMADGEMIEVPVSEGEKRVVDGETYYVFSCAVNAKEMTDDVVSQFFYNGGSNDAFTYNVQTYADYLLENSTDEEVKELVTAMLNYGAASQTHFGYNTDNLANEKLDAPDYTDVTIEGFDAVAGQGTDSAEFYSASLLLKSETTLRFFFQVAEGVEETFTVSYNGQNLEVKERSGLYYVDVVGISAKDLDENVTITINDGTKTANVTYNPMAYCQSVWNDNNNNFDQNMKNLVAALYQYNQAANTYLEEN